MDPSLIVICSRNPFVLNANREYYICTGTKTTFFKTKIGFCNSLIFIYTYFSALGLKSRVQCLSVLPSSAYKMFCLKLFILCLLAGMANKLEGDVDEGEWVGGKKKLVPDLFYVFQDRKYWFDG